MARNFAFKFCKNPAKDSGRNLKRLHRYPLASHLSPNQGRSQTKIIGEGGKQILNWQNHFKSLSSYDLRKNNCEQANRPTMRILILFC